MSEEKLITTMEKILKLHRSLFELARMKTEIVKKGDINALNQLIKDEQAHIAAINKFEKERQKLAGDMVPSVDKPSVADCLKACHHPGKETLGRLRTELLDLISQIQQRNELNQQMLYQSLQFVNFSINLIAPQPESINYGPKAGKVKQSGYSTALFNSKA